ncbi:MAG: tryptophan-rich sensory protein [Candidatus ainarchaeum sp.]|nr:tryptophan-rich sensory protein [Candidatus ainarchaeum sp.]
MKPREIGIAALFIIACLAAGAIGALATYPAIPGWYASLNKPAFSPPNWVFGPVWTALYVLMGIAAYIVYSAGMKKPAVHDALVIFGVQLGLNLLWSLLFFGLQSPLYGLVCIVALWAAIAVTIIRFYAISRTAGLLLVPYILWVSFASLLNFYVWALN